MKRGGETPIKITFIGDAGVGKTSLVGRLVRQRFNPTITSTIGAAFCTMRHGARLYHIWDTAGQERYNSLVPLYISGSSVIVMVYDITNRHSFDRIVDHWIPYIRQNLRMREDEAMPMLYLLGNKIDLASTQRQVLTDDVKSFAHDNEIGFTEVSALSGEGADKVVNQIAKHADDMILRQAESVRQSRGVGSFNVEDDDNGTVYNRCTGCAGGAMGRLWSDQ